jgi:hypothetical protein
MSDYNYTVTLPFDLSNLSNNIMSSSISPMTTSICLNSTNLIITFDSALSQDEENELQNLINNNNQIIKKIPINNTINIVSVASTTNGILTTDFTEGKIIDGITLKKNFLILIKDQTNGVENGIYSIKESGSPEREILLNNTNSGGSIILVNQGASNANKMWTCANEIGSDIVGVDELIFEYYNPITPTQVHIPFGDNTSGYIVLQPLLSNVYNSIKTFMYSHNQENMVKFELVYSMTSSLGSFDFRIQDITNSKTIATINNLTNTNGVVTTANTTTFTNIPITDSVFEIQYRETTGNQSKITLHTAYFEYS